MPVLLMEQLDVFVDTEILHSNDFNSLAHGQYQKLKLFEDPNAEQ
jgi:hypothetical protein